MSTAAKTLTNQGENQFLGGQPLIVTFMDRSGSISIERVAASFGLSKTQLAETVGLYRESLYKAGRSRTPKIRTHERDA